MRPLPTMAMEPRCCAARRIAGGAGAPIPLKYCCMSQNGRLHAPACCAARDARECCVRFVGSLTRHASGRARRNTHADWHILQETAACTAGAMRFDVHDGRITLRLKRREHFASLYFGSPSSPVSSVRSIRVVENPWKDSTIRGVRAPGTGIPFLILLGTTRRELFAHKTFNVRVSYSPRQSCEVSLIGMSVCSML